MLELFQDEARHYQHAGDEAGLSDVGDAPIDDGAGIYQNLVLITAIGLFPEAAPQLRQFLSLLAVVVVRSSRAAPRRPAPIAPTIEPNRRAKSSLRQTAAAVQV